MPKKSIRRHLELCLKASEFISKENKCIFCPQRSFTQRRDVFKHVLEAHTDQLEQEDLDHLEREDLDQLEREDLENDTEEHDDIMEESPPPPPTLKKVPNFQLMQPNQPLVTYRNVQENFLDPNLVTKLYSCPFCNGKLAFFQHAQDHVVKFHNIKLDQMRKLQLSFTEESV